MTIEFDEYPVRGKTKVVLPREESAYPWQHRRHYFTKAEQSARGSGDEIGRTFWENGAELHRETWMDRNETKKLGIRPARC